MPGKTVEKNIGHIAFTVIMWVLAIMMVMPFVMMVIISFRTQGEAYEPIFAPFTPILRNYQQVIGHENFVDWYVNTFETVIITIILRLIVTLPAAYAFSRIKFRGSRAIMAVLMATLMVPGETTMVPRYLYFSNINLLDSIWVIILPEISEVFYLMLMSEFFRSIPEDLSEAAKIDGCTFFQTFIKIILPVLKPVMGTIALLSFRQGWNEYIMPLVFTMARDNLRPLTVGVNMLKATGGGAAAWNVMFAGASIAVVPMLIIYIIFNKNFMSGSTAGAVKG